MYFVLVSDIFEVVTSKLRTKDEEADVNFQVPKLLQWQHLKERTLIKWLTWVKKDDDV